MPRTLLLMMLVTVLFAACNLACADETVIIVDPVTGTATPVIIIK